MLLIQEAKPQTQNYQQPVSAAPTNTMPPTTQTGGLNLVAPVPQSGNDKLSQAHNPPPKKSPISGFVIAIATLSFVTLCGTIFTQSIIPAVIGLTIIIAAYGGYYIGNRQK